MSLGGSFIYIELGYLAASDCKRGWEKWSFTILLISIVEKRKREGLEYPLGCQSIALAKGPPSLEEKGLVNSGARSGQGPDNGLWTSPVHRPEKTAGYSYSSTSACHPVNNSRGKRRSISAHKTRPDSPLPTMQGAAIGIRNGEAQKSPDTPGSPEGNTEGPGTASSEPLLPS